MDVGILILIPILLIGIMVFLYVVPLGLWVSALAAGVNVGIFTLVGMRFTSCKSISNCNAFN